MLERWITACSVIDWVFFLFLSSMNLHLHICLNDNETCLHVRAYIALLTLNPCKSFANIDKSKLWTMIKYPPVVQITNLLASGLIRHRMRPAVWKTFWYVYPCSVLEFMSHVKILPSKPEVTSKLSFREYSMFFTQFKWPCSDRTLDFRLRVSHSATVESSLHVANKRPSMNLIRFCCVNITNSLFNFQSYFD